MSTQGLGTEEIDHRFGYHPPLSRIRVEEHTTVRAECRALALELDHLLPDSREKSLVFTKLEEAMFWANAALARAPDPDAEVSEGEAAAGPRDG